MVEVVLHVGAHKCATTALQRSFRSLAAANPALSYIPPESGPRPGRDDARHVELHDLIQLGGRGAESGVGPREVADGLCRLIDRRARQERVVISDENSLGAMPGVRWLFYPNAPLVREVVDRIARRFPTRLLLQSRETAGYLRSCHRFRVRRGMTLSYAGFLERFDLGSISWLRLGETLSDPAWETHVLPLERIGDGAALAAAFRFVAPGWSVEDAPLVFSNRANGPLAQAAALVFNRARVTIDAGPRGALVAALAGIEDEAAAAERPEAIKLIASTLDGLGIEAGPRLVRMIRAQHEEERGPPGHLDALIAKRFAGDYDAFLKRCAPSEPAEQVP